jgi:hypothetical protein
MTQISFFNTWFTIPQQWNELTKKQLLGIMHVFNQGHPLDVTMVKLLMILTGMKKWQRALVSPHDVNEYLYLTEFLIRENHLTKNLLPKYAGMYGPADNFNNLVMDEFVFSEQFYLDWKADETKIENLNKLVAVLYRPGKNFYKGWLYNHLKNPSGDHRKPFNENLCMYNSTHSVKLWPHDVKVAIAEWYGACREQMTKDFPAVFSSGGDLAKYGLLSMMRNVAAGRVHGNFRDVETQFVKMIMIELDEMISEAEAIKKSQNGYHG